MKLFQNWVARCALVVLTIGCETSTDVPAQPTVDAASSTADTAVGGDAAAAATGGDTADTTTDGDSTMSGDTPADACTPGTLGGAIINKDHVAGPPPAMTGGAIVDGTYALTKMVQYNGGTGVAPHKDSIIFAAGKGQILGAKDGTGTMKVAFFDYTTSGDELTLTLRCGATGTVKLKYTATPTTFSKVNEKEANEVHTFTKM